VCFERSHHNIVFCHILSFLFYNICICVCICIYTSKYKCCQKINHIQNKVFVNTMCVCCVYLLCIYKYIHMHVYISETFYVYILIIFIYTCKYKKIYKVCVCACLYIHNKYTQDTHILSKQKHYSGFFKYAINRWTAQNKHTHAHTHTHTKRLYIYIKYIY